MSMELILDRQAYRHYAPSELHDHFAAFDRLLASAVRRDRGTATLVANPLHLFSAKKRYPVIHLVAMKDRERWRYFQLPFETYAIKEGHRFVSEDGASTKAIAQPQFCFEVVADPSLNVFETMKGRSYASADELRADAELMRKFNEGGKDVAIPSVLLTAPIALLRRGVAGRFLQQKYTLYQHIFGSGAEYPNDGPFYIGITSRDWKKRWREHWAAIQRGSGHKFHRVYRERMAERALTYVHHKVMGVAPSLDQIQDLEEAFVQGHWDDERLLNMIPGGKAGIAYLHRHRMLDEQVRPTPDKVEGALEEWAKDHPRKGSPAPWIAEAWQRPEYASQVICGRDDRLNVDQVLQIRLLASGGVSTDDIAKQIGFSRERVEKVVDGKTYARVVDRALPEV